MPRRMPDEVLGQAVTTRDMVSIEMQSAKWENWSNGCATSDWCSRSLSERATFELRL